MWWVLSVELMDRSKVREAIKSQAIQRGVEHLIVDMDKLCSDIESLIRYQVPEKEGKKYQIDLSGYTDHGHGAVTISIVHYPSRFRQAA